MKCPHCDQEHPEATSFCPYTGKQILHNISCLNCGEVYDSQLAACPKCGTPLDLKLPPEVHQTEKQVPAGIEIKAPTKDTSPRTITAPPDELAVQHGPAMDTFPEQESPASPINTQPALAVSASPEQASPAGIAVEQIVSANKHGLRDTLGCIACGCVGTPLFILLFLAVIVFGDPFHLHMLGRLNGSFDAAAEVMPADAGVYLGFNLGNALLTRVDRRLTPFTPSETTTQSSMGYDYLHAQIDPSQAEQLGLFADLFHQIEQETGVKIPDDISPWVGQYAGIGAVGFQESSSGSQIPTGWIIALEARNITRADMFLESLQGNLADIQNMTFIRQTYNGVPVIVQEENGEVSGLSFGRAGRMILIAADLDILKDAIDNPAKHGLSAQVEYKRLIDMRPRTWSASLYMSHEAFGSLAEGLMQGGLVASAVTTISPLSSPWSGMLLSVTAIQEGLRFDGYSILDVSSQSPATDELVQKWYTAPAVTIQRLPQETVVYLANSRFELFSQSLLSYATSDPSESSYFFDAFEQTFGFSLKDDMLDHLNGQWAIYAVPSTHGILPDQANLTLAVGLLVQTDNQIDLQSISDKLNYAGQPMGLTVESQQRDGIKYYEVGNITGVNPVLVFGADNGYFALGTDIDALQTSSSSDTSLVNSASYQKAIDALPAGMQPSMYIDLEGLLANLREGMDASELESFNKSISTIEPIHMIASANRLIQPGVAHSSVVVILSAK